MSQNDFTLANQSFPAFRADLNSALQALASNSSGGSAPSTTFANMWWYDTTNNIMYIRNEDNDAWIKFAELDQANDKFVLSGTLQLDDGTVSAPALTFNSDTNMGIYRGGTDILKFVTAGTDAITIDASQDVTIAGTATMDGLIIGSPVFPTGVLKVKQDADNTRARGILLEANADDSLLAIGYNNGKFSLSASYNTGGSFQPISVFTSNFERLTVDTNGDISFYEDPGTTPKLFWDASAERLGIGTASPTYPLHVLKDSDTDYNPSTASFNTILTLKNTTSGALNNALMSFATESNGEWYIGGVENSANTASDFVFVSRDSGARAERLRIDSSGNVGIGTDSPSVALDVVDSRATSYSATADQRNLAMITARNPSDATNRFASINLVNGGGTQAEASINLVQAGNYIGHLTFKSRTGGSTWAERMRIDSSGHLLVGKTSSGLSVAGFEARNNQEVYVVRNNDTPLQINRLGNDGALVGFYQATTLEGTISVSGSTVSYNGGHLARWSQLADNTRDGSIVKGTVMTNLDQMAEWTTDGVTEDNEQLNCMAVSSVEGDANVAGVFVNWDNDDDIYTNDMNIAMTGDMVIRIAQGTTVARGDLLMSAGDGTAKPQGDDIVRSKTIAKVTSTNVSHTYDDGTYLVPCVLMAC